MDGGSPMITNLIYVKPLSHFMIRRESLQRYGTAKNPCKTVARGNAAGSFQ